MTLWKLAAIACSSTALLCMTAQGAGGQQTALSVTGSPSTFTITTAVAGSQPAALTNTATSYTVTVRNSAGVKKITAQLDAPMPAGTSLSIALAAPAGATSLGDVTLDATARDVVVNLAGLVRITQSITYTFSAATSAGVVPILSRTATLTLVNYP